MIKFTCGNLELDSSEFVVNYPSSKGIDTSKLRAFMDQIIKLENGEIIVTFSKQEDIFAQGFIFNSIKPYCRGSKFVLHPNPLARDDKIKGPYMMLSDSLTDNNEGMSGVEIVEAFPHDVLAWAEEGMSRLTQDIIKDIERIIKEKQIDTIIYPDASSYNRMRHQDFVKTTSYIIYEKTRGEDGTITNSILKEYIHDSSIERKNILILDDILCKGGTINAIPKNPDYNYFVWVCYTEGFVTELDGIKEIHAHANYLY